MYAYGMAIDGLEAFPGESRDLDMAAMLALASFVKVFRLFIKYSRSYTEYNGLDLTMMVMTLFMVMMMMFSC